jgi:fatty-acyl-CoA synthase
MNLIDRIISDIKYVRGFQKLVKVAGAVPADSEFMLGDFIEQQVDLHAQKPFIVFEGHETSYAEFDARANQFAHWGLSVGLRPGDSVALFMGNRPDYIAFWAGMSKIAVRTALINYNLAGPGLAHCISVASARVLVMEPDLSPAYEAARAELKLDLGVWTLGPGAAPAGANPLEPVLPSMSSSRPDRSHRAGLKVTEIALYIYTSGTTGLPKAAKITNMRAQGLMKVFVPAVGVTDEDRIFLTLPLYHATGGMCGVGCAIYTGATLLLQRKFSASHFWEDAVATHATMLVYIGELGRYLMNLPPTTLEKSHSIVKAFGNGLRADVWAEFVERTGIKRLVEFYGSTEGNVNFFNLDGRIGAVGRIPPILRSKLKARLLKFDVDTEQPVRGPDGLCIEAAIDEPGEAVGPISSEPRERFDGYNDESQTKKKILRDVFVKGDMWFRTGDLMRRDKDGYIYFVDRVGDTFRWKSENVSTGEVELALSAMPGVSHAVVYGVQVAGQDGRAGMAALTAPGGVDLQALYRHLVKRLPAYARPVFVRLQPEVETTGTFKYRKVELVEQGFDPKKADEPVFVVDNEHETYAPIDEDMLANIESGAIRL